MSAASRALTGSPAFLRIIAGVCLFMALVAWATVLVALFDPPQWSRADRFLYGWAWFYVGYLHWLLARVAPTPDGAA